ncbi:hypothetical protein K458DRAFT_480342 [Lentithecium fluviatile CBS 122367]|uniref:N-acetyltransferase domain-containing protein n=1 Tax=Lentithecium fluviatile CBS 122367 TaxID=1168545 RepID=A0A6G1INA4_9PLEO|nr:hypothetical protein K458DRAFT_480342 [Lentithecium fluviatile CBS 122367]
MPLAIALVTSESDFDQLCEMDYDAWQTPYNPQLKHFRASFPTRAEAIAWDKARKIRSLRKQNPKLFYVKCTDTDTDTIIGYANWMVNDSPEPYEEPTKAVWHPEGSDEREFAERFINGLWGFIGERVTRPHMDLHAVCVHPDHRKRGVGRMLIRWGIEKGDELGIETVISSLPSARGAYEKCGLGCIEIIPPDPSLNVENPSERWKELQAEDLSGWLMWRPIGHDYVEGVDRAPWL